MDTNHPKPRQKFLDKFYTFFIRHREHTITAFKILYLILVVFLFVGGRATLLRDESAIEYYNLALTSGKAAIVVYILTTIPGIAKRFGLRHKLISLLMIYRRYLGITMYMLVLIHFWIVKGVTVFFHRILVLPPPLFQVMGATAAFLLFFLFVTSNDIALGKLKIWWYRLHKLTYIAVWFIFLHVALQRFSIWTVLIGITAIVQISSHLYGRLHKSRLPNIQPQ